MDQSQTMARRSVRHDVAIRAAISIHPSQVGSIRFGAGAGARDGWVDVDMVDFSSSGLGVIASVFVPRRAMLVVRAWAFGPDAPVILEVPVRVQRVCMVDRRPAYLIGTAFADPSPQADEQINALLKTLDDTSVLPDPTT